MCMHTNIDTWHELVATVTTAINADFYRIRNVGDVGNAYKITQFLTLFLKSHIGLPKKL